jgi:peroxiredoxin
MANRREEKQRLAAERLRKEAERQRARRTRTLGIRVATAVAVGLVVLGGIFLLSGGGRSSSGPGKSGQYAFQVGQPGPGQQAPAIDLPQTSGGTFNLANQRGKTVMLYFQEGLTCQPCWDQLTDLQPQMRQLNAVGINELVSITTDPLDQLMQKVADEKISIPVLSDASRTVSTAYAGNQYGMMGNSRDGHTFIVIGPNGRIEWRADYGGAPNYTMYVPVPDLIADLRKGLGERRS